MGRLLLTRRRGEEVRITLPSGQLVRVTPVEVHNGNVKLMFDADQSILIDREEVALLRDADALLAQPKAVPHGQG